jgi:OOP family OmpA-OmpF porin
MIRGFLAGIAMALAGTGASAQALDLPRGAVLIAETVTAGTDTPFPMAAWGRFDPVTARAEGTVTRRVWRIGSGGLTTLQILQPLREQLASAGYTIDFECADLACGGFDFRFALDLIGEPDMHVDLGDFRYLAATRKAGAGVDRIALVVSRSEAAGFVHLTAIAPGDGAPPETATDAPPQNALPTPLGTAASDVAVVLATDGHAALSDLDFATGSAALGPGPFASLEALASWLGARPEAAAILVGHTDAAGSLDQNLALSRARAQAVRTRLVESYGIEPGRLDAQGVGYLAPRAPNDTEAGRQMNRRVEVILPATD